MEMLTAILAVRPGLPIGGVLSIFLYFITAAYLQAPLSMKKRPKPRTRTGKEPAALPARLGIIDGIEDAILIPRDRRVGIEGRPGREKKKSPDSKNPGF
jgi:hypothetical protein